MKLDDLFGLEGKVAVVTGGSRGIGEMIATGLVHNGVKVYITSRSADACEETAAKLNEIGECVPIAADLSKEDDVVRFAGEVASSEGAVHILVNNAGTNWAEEIDTYPVAGFDKVMTLNVRSVFHTTQQMLPLLGKAGTKQDPARVVNIGSIDGLRVPHVESYAYSSSKAAVHQLTRHLAANLIDRNVTVNAIAPGLFKTKMTRVFYQDDATLEFVQGGIPMGRDGDAEDIAGTTIWLCSRAGSFLTGAVIPCDGGVSTR